MGCCSDSSSSVTTGGVIKGSDVISCDIVNSTFQAGTVDGCAMTNLTSLDNASAKTIVEAFINNLTSAQLSALAQKIIASIEATGSAPATTVDKSLPTTMFGKRTAVLGTPEKWIELAGGVVPCYSK